MRPGAEREQGKPMTPKEQYEARKAERKAKLADQRYRESEAAKKDTEFMDMLDRFVTAVERIADAREEEAKFLITPLKPKNYEAGR